MSHIVRCQRALFNQYFILNYLYIVYVYFYLIFWLIQGIQIDKMAKIWILLPVVSYMTEMTLVKRSSYQVFLMAIPKNECLVTRDDCTA